jgi:hypothetical protein
VKSDAGVPKNYFKMLRHDIKGPLARDAAWISKVLAEDEIRTYIIIAYDKVYDVSGYMTTVNPPDFVHVTNLVW